MCGHIHRKICYGSCELKTKFGKYFFCLRSERIVALHNTLDIARSLITLLCPGLQPEKLTGRLVCLSCAGQIEGYFLNPSVYHSPVLFEGFQEDSRGASLSDSSTPDQVVFFFPSRLSVNKFASGDLFMFFGFLQQFSYERMWNFVPSVHQTDNGIQKRSRINWIQKRFRFSKIQKRFTNVRCTYIYTYISSNHLYILFITFSNILLPNKYHNFKHFQT